MMQKSGHYHYHRQGASPPPKSKACSLVDPGGRHCQIGKLTRKRLSSTRITSKTLFEAYPTSEAYKIYQPQNKIIMIKDVRFIEKQKWIRDDQKTKRCKKGQHLKSNLTNGERDQIDVPPIRGTRQLETVHQRCNVSVCEHARWQVATLEELIQI